MLIRAKRRRSASRTTERWARLVLMEASAIHECEEHGWAQRQRQPPHCPRACDSGLLGRARRPVSLRRRRSRRSKTFSARSAIPGPSAHRAECGRGRPAPSGEIFLLESLSFGRIWIKIPWPQQSEEDGLAIQIVMDRSGDSRHHFNPSDAREVAKAAPAVLRADESRLHRRDADRSGKVSQVRRSIRAQKKPCSFPGSSAADRQRNAALEAVSPR